MSHLGEKVVSLQQEEPFRMIKLTRRERTVLPMKIGIYEQIIYKLFEEKVSSIGQSSI